MPGRHTDPELRKVLGVIQTHLSETRRLLATPKTRAPLRNPAAARELTSLAHQDPATLTVLNRQPGRGSGAHGSHGDPTRAQSVDPG